MLGISLTYAGVRHSTASDPAAENSWRRISSSYVDPRAGAGRGSAAASFALVDAVGPWPEHQLSQVVAGTLFNVTTNTVATSVK